MIDEDFYRLMHRLGKAWQRCESGVVACEKLTISECRLLHWLEENPEGNLEQLSAFLDVTRGRLTRVLDALEEKGLVSRKEDKEDRRAVTLLLTAAGKRKLSAARESRCQDLERVLGVFRPGELDTLNELLGRLANELEKRKS